MPLGFFQAEKVKIVKEKPPAEKSVRAPVRKNYEVHLISRTQGQALEFLCSMNENMNSAAAGQGLSFYIPDHNTMREISAEKQMINAFFRSFSEKEWMYDTEGDKAVRNYCFELAPAGLQTKAIRITIHVHSGDKAALPGHYDALWLLSDAAAQNPARSQGDPYTQNLRRIIGRLPVRTGEFTPAVCLILSQYEAQEESDSILGNREPDVMECRGWRNAFSGAAKSGAGPAVIAAQVLGGMRFQRFEEDFTPVLKMSASVKKYRPSGCHIPMMFSLQTSLQESGEDFFADSMEGGLSGAVQGCYDDQFADPSWTPERL
jgi:hypothetical protein